MSANEPSKYLLFRGDTLLGTITHDQGQDDWPWQYGSFASSPEFASARHLFDKGVRLLGARRNEEFARIWTEIQEPGLRMQMIGTNKILRGGLVHIDGEKVSWRSMRDTP